MLRPRYVDGFPQAPVSLASPPTAPLEPVLGAQVDNSSDTEDKIAAAVGIPLGNDSAPAAAARSTRKKKNKKSDKISEPSSSDHEYVSYDSSSGDEEHIDVVGDDDDDESAASDQPSDGDEAFSSSENDSKRSNKKRSRTRSNKKRIRTRKTASSSSSSESDDDEPVLKKSRHEPGDEVLSSSERGPEKPPRNNKKRSRARSTVSSSSSSSSSESDDDEPVLKKLRCETRNHENPSSSESDEDDYEEQELLLQKQLLEAVELTPFAPYASIMFLPGKSQQFRQMAKVNGTLGTWSDVYDLFQKEFNSWASENDKDLLSFIGCTNLPKKQQKVFENRSMFIDFLKSIKQPEESVLAKEQREVLAQRSVKPKSSRKTTKTRRSATPKMTVPRESSAKPQIPASDGKEVESEKHESKSRTDVHGDSEDEHSGRHSGLADEKDTPQVPKKAGTYDLDSTLEKAIVLATFKIWTHSQRFGKQLTREDLAEIMDSSVAYSSGDSADAGAVQMRKCLPDQPHVSVDFRFWDFHYASQWTQVAAAIEAHVITGSNEALEQLELPAEKLANWIVFAMVYYPEGKYKIPEIPSVDEFDFGSMFP